MGATHKMRWGIIGLGEIANTFATALPQSQTGVLEAVASSDAHRAARFAARFGTRALPDYESLLADPHVDVVYIATAHTDHAQWAIRAAEAGKHVLCEKPLSPHPATSMAMIEAALGGGVVLREGYMYRHHPRIPQVIRMIAEGVIGNVHHTEASYSFHADRSVGRLYDPSRAGGGVLDVGGYPASFVMSVAAAAQGAAAQLVEPVELTAEGELSAEGVDLWTRARLTFPAGLTADITAGIGREEEQYARVEGTSGTILLPRPWLVSHEEETLIIVERASEAPTQIVVPRAAPYALEADAVAVAVAAARTDDGRALDKAASEESMAVARTQQRWRTALGVRYPFEMQAAYIPPVRGGELTRSRSLMPYGSIAQSPKRISRLVMGCDNQPDLTYASVMWDDFFERGGNAFDTAYEYNDRLQEKLLGQWMTNRGVRDDVFLIGKGAHTPYCDPQNLESQLLETLEDLQTDHLDMYFMHRDNEDIPVGEFIDVLDRYYQSGALKAFGGSNWSRERFEAANAYARANGKQPMTALSNHFGLAEALALPWEGCRHVTDPESKRWLAEEQIPVFAWASQARGFFARADPADSSDPQLVRCFYSEENFERLRRCRQLSAELGVSPTAVALAYVLHQEFPTFALFGPRTLAETRTSMKALDVSLNPEQAAWLDLRA